ncbi:MAG: hypothetical protein M1829_004657 [Trizodia sp. TS-e1964]|nr:MAG: hypothetical protein M1829_004657 [Trizodia sp. TS-e1964]
MPQSIFSLGSNGSGQLGIGHCEDASIPTLSTLPENTVTDSPPKIAAGGNHTLALFPSGDIYAAGSNSDGRCGLTSNIHSSHTFYRIPLELKSTSKIKLFTATWEASILVTSDDKVFAFGAGTKGELGLGEKATASNEPRIVLGFPPPGTSIVDIASGLSHTIVVLSNGEVYGWGNGRKGQLGEPTAIIWSPRKVGGLDFHVVRAVCGREFTYLVGAPDQGVHVILGTDKWDLKSTAPPSVPGWIDIGAAWGSIFVLQSNLSLMSWGRNDHGQLSPKTLPPIHKIAIGSEHAIAVTQDGDVIAWGWGEHGNCGPNTDLGDVNGRWNTLIPIEFKTCREFNIGIGAGCATSWLCLRV